MPWPTIEDFANFAGHDVEKLSTNAVTLLLEMAQSAIAAEMGRDDAWAAALNPVPKVVAGICMQIAQRVLSNPDAVQSLSEGIGTYNQSRSWADVGISLTRGEATLARRALGMSGTVSVRLPSIITELFENMPDPSLTLEADDDEEVAD